MRNAGWTWTRQGDGSFELHDGTDVDGMNADAYAGFLKLLLTPVLGQQAPYLFFVAAVFVSGILGERLDAVAIFIIVVLNGIKASSIQAREGFTTGRRMREVEQRGATAMECDIGQKQAAIVEQHPTGYRQTGAHLRQHARRDH